MKIKVAFYKGKGNCVNTIVRWWTNSVYSHAELILDDNITWIGISPFVKSKINKRIILATTKAKEIYSNFKFKKDDTLLFGRESSGVPERIHKNTKFTFDKEYL